METPEKSEAAYANAPVSEAAGSVEERLAPQTRVSPPLPSEEPAKKLRKKAKRGGRASAREFVVFFDGILSFLMIVALGLGVLGAYFNQKFIRPGPVAEDRTILIPPRSGSKDIAEILERNGLIEDATIFRLGALIDRKGEDLKAGEYLIPKSSSMRDIVDILRLGHGIQYGITIPEGLTSLQIVQRLREVDVLAGEIRHMPPEGSLLPDTYRVTRGTSREVVVQLMQRAQRKVLDEAWKRRAANLPLRSPEELLTLASIVEKETGKADERPRVAAVFVNRLAKRIRLQSDPTTIYGIVGGQGGLGRGLTRQELDRPTPYNTYVIQGLPPTPIANPGKDAIEAVANPARTNELYFVADGTGGHAFSETLLQHQRAVQRWRGVERARGDDEEGADQSPASAQPALPVRQAPRRAPAAPPRAAGSTTP